MLPTHHHRPLFFRGTPNSCTPALHRIELSTHMRAYPHNRRWLQASLSNDQEAAIACELSTFRHHLTACHLLQVAREALSLVASADEESVVKLVDKHHFGGSSAFAGIQPPNTGSHATVLAAVMSRRRCVLCALRFISFVAGGTTVGAEAYGRRQRQRIRSITSGTTTTDCLTSDSVSSTWFGGGGGGGPRHLHCN